MKGKLRRILKEFEKFCISWKRTLAILWAINQIIYAFYPSLILYISNILLCLLWGIGFQIPQDAYRWIKERRKTQNENSSR